MGQFLDTLNCAIHSLDYKQRPCELLSEFRYEANDGSIITVPAGYRSDFASVPRFFWRVFPPMGKYTWAAIVHDWLCDQKDERGSDYAADIFLECMTALGVGRIRRNSMHKAVKWFGPKF